ncbi:Bromodomain-containing protein 4 [Rhizoctonia solani]|uniref:Bromodomain-containing protein 4 n=1 Tax=Rhizoctonia solani TaxID=456999 RepID=A0A0K6GH19_9AGAM|nr:Bromodomain-containing protein 4 [Rhizoctonia solani]
MNTLEESKRTFRFQEFSPVKVGNNSTSVPPPSQAETLMSTQEAKERAESKSKQTEKGKAREAQTTPATTRSQLPTSVTKPNSLQTNAPANSPQMNKASDKPNSTSTPSGTLTVPAPQPPSRTATAPETPNTTTSPNALPLKRGPGRPRKSDVNTGPPPAKRPRGRPRNVTTPAILARPRNEATDEDVPNAENDEDSDYHDSNDEAATPPHILAQFNAHVTLLRTRLDSRGIPEQYSIYKAFWLATRSAYFDNGATATPGRFLYWDPLFITSVGCPVCQQPLAIAAGGGWLDAPLGLHDGEGPCWIIGRRYVCTQCFAATEEAAKYVQVPSSNPDAAEANGETKPKVLKPDFSSPVYYLSWEKRFRALLPPSLQAEFPMLKRAQKRAAFSRASLGIELTAPGDGDGDMDIDAEGEPDGEGEEEETSKRSRRVRHCMKCGSKSCPGHSSRARCLNPCHDCGLLTCDGRTKPNLTCKGQLAAPFKQAGQDESSSMTSGTSPTAPAAPSIWPAGLPQIPSGFVLAIPYPVGVDGKPTGTQPPMAYLVPQGEVPGFSFTKNQPGPSSEAPAIGGDANTNNAPLAPTPAPTTTDVNTASASVPSTTQTEQTTPVDASSSLEQSQSRAPENVAQSKTNVQPRASSKQKTPQRKVPPAQAPNPTTTHSVNPQAQLTANALHPNPQQPLHHPPSHPPAPPPPSHPPPHASAYHPPHGASYHPPPPPPGGSPEQGYYGFYPYGYMPPYGYGYYPPYPPGPGQNPAPGGPLDNMPPGPPYPQYTPYAASGYPAPPPGHTYPPPNGPYLPLSSGAPSSAPPNGYNSMHPQPPQAVQPPPQYLPYQPEFSRSTTTAGPATKKRKAPPAPASGDKPTDT